MSFLRERYHAEANYLRPKTPTKLLRKVPSNDEKKVVAEEGESHEDDDYRKAGSFIARPEEEVTAVRKPRKTFEGLRAAWWSAVRQ